RAAGDFIHWRPKLTELGDQFDQVWYSTISPNGTLTDIRDFPHFPNPHIRTNVFMLWRDDFLAVPLGGRVSKTACCSFESGYDGLSLTTLRKGLRLLVVGADGV